MLMQFSGRTSEELWREEHVKMNQIYVAELKSAQIFRDDGTHPPILLDF